MRRLFVLLVITLAVATGPFVPVNSVRMQVGRVKQSVAGSDGLLYINPPNTTNLPVGSEFNVSVQAAGVAYFNGWDVFVHTNTSVISAVSMSIANDYFFANSTDGPAIQVLADCINNTVIVGSSCGQAPPGGPGVAEFAAIFFGTQPPANIFPAYGPLFNITYKVTAPNGFSGIDFVNATLVDSQPPSYRNLNIATVNGFYGTQQPDFSVTVNPSTPVVPQGFSGSTMINITSSDLFKGVVDLNVSTAAPVHGLSLSFNYTTLKLIPDGSNSTVLTVYANRYAAAELYPITVTATSGNIIHSTPFEVLVETSPFFELQLIPAQLIIADGNSANTTIQLQGEQGFQGSVNLTVQAPTALGVVVRLSSASIALSVSSGTSSTSLEVMTPVVSLPYRYAINVTATGLANGLPFSITETLFVRAPAANLLVSAAPSSLTVHAGDSVSGVINVTSLNYFWGFFSVSASMAGGAVGFSSEILYIALPNSTHANYTPSQTVGMRINVTSNTPPGYYIARVTVYAIATSYQGAVSQQIAVPIVVTAPILGKTGTVLGLAAPVYFGILGILGIPLIVLSIAVYRRREKEDSNWRA